MIEIVWVGHSCFEIRFHEYRILIDPFSPESFDHILPRTKYGIVFATHKAQDHDFFDGVEADTYLLASGDKDEFISKRQDEEQNIPGKIVRKTATSQFSFWTVASFHDDQQGAVDGFNGIICLDFNGVKVVHLGDLGHVLEEGQLGRIGAVDVLMIPVDGYFTVDLDTAKFIIRQLAPKIVIPMHYRTARSKSTGPIYTEEDIIAGFQKARKLNQSHLIIDGEILDRGHQVLVLDYLEGEDFPALEGPYLGQTPPGLTPEVFAPGIVCTEKNEGYLVFLDHGRVLVFDRWLPQTEGPDPYLVMEMRNGRWTRPRSSNLPQCPSDPVLPIRPDERTLFFALNRAADGMGESHTEWDIWMTRWTDRGFSSIRRLEAPISSEKRDAWPSLAKNGNLYFMSNRDGGHGRWDIYKAEYKDGSYSNIQNIGHPVNSDLSEADPAVAPDEGYLLFCSQRPGGFGGLDLYITFHKQDGTWTAPQNMGPEINTPANEEKPYVTPDGKYLFFSNDASGNLEIYWVNAEIIDDLYVEDEMPIRATSSAANLL